MTSVHSDRADDAIFKSTEGATCATDRQCTPELELLCEGLTATGDFKCPRHNDRGTRVWVDLKMNSDSIETDHVCIDRDG